MSMKNRKSGEKNPDLNIEGTVSQKVSNALWKTTKNSINMNLQRI